MKIAIAGGSGLIGQAVAKKLLPGNDLVILSRNPARVRIGRGVEWHPGIEGAWQREVADADAIVNLAGENIGAARWSEERKKELRVSRIAATQALVDVVRRNRKSDRVFVSASAIGVYGDRGDEVLDESSPAGEGFLAELARDWEHEARLAEDAARVVITRFGIVLSKDGGALPRMLTPFRLGVGGRVGSGDQWWSWVVLDDIVSVIEWSLTAPGARGVYNATAPNPVTNRKFTAALGEVMHRPTIVPAPGFALKAMLGEMAEALLLASQRVVPNRTMGDGFRFTYMEIDQALRHVLR
jgi:hypothetical protein